MSKQRKSQSTVPVGVRAYGTYLTCTSQSDADLVQEWIDADPLNAMRQRGRDVMDVRSFRFVQHRHPRTDGQAKP